MATLNDTPAAVTTDPPDREITPEAARHVARAYLTEMTPAWVRDHARGEDCESPNMFLAIADAMDELLAEGFDPAAFAGKLRAGNSGPSAERG
jgi:hypothetical protein